MNAPINILLTTRELYIDKLRSVNTYYLYLPMRAYRLYENHRNPIKAKCFIDYIRDTAAKNILSTKHYSIKWKVSIRTAYRWTIQFKDQQELFISNMEQDIEQPYTVIPSNYTKTLGIKNIKKLYCFIDYLSHYLSHTDYAPKVKGVLEYSRLWGLRKGTTYKFLTEFYDDINGGFEVAHQMAHQMAHFNPQKQGLTEIQETPLETPLETHKERVLKKEYFKKDSLKIKGVLKNPKFLNISSEVLEFKNKLVSMEYVGVVAAVYVEFQDHQVYIGKDRKLYTDKKASNQIVKSTLEEIWTQCYESNESNKAAQAREKLLEEKEKENEYKTMQETIKRLTGQI